MTAYLEGLRALVLTMMASLSPHLPPDAPVIADAIAVAVLTEERPALASANLDLAALVDTAWEESRFRIEPRAYSHDAKDGTSCGAFQTACASLPRTLVGQARKALWLIRLGAQSCPDSPLSPYLGACRTGLGRRIGDARLRSSLAIIRAPAPSSVAERSSASVP